MLVKAAVDGVVDFSHVNLLDSRWHRRLKFLLDEMLRQENIEQLKLLQNRSLAYITCPILEPPTVADFIKGEEKLMDSINAALYGGSEEKENRKSKIADMLRKAWEREYGNLQDGDVQRRIQETADMLKQRRLENPRKKNERRHSV